ncbi:MAG: hypothetical protein UR15_C0001G0019 [Parcubacteria group bacterium GW2011_GWA2_31_28]|nr:MAG: hypothetical protein UR15_C0001G0019 [Parcubacteria group bacterium GW2011_GWA2_31_28]
MKIKNKDQYLENNIIPKLLNVINKHFPKAEEKSIPYFAKEIEKYNKDITDKGILFYLFIQWFLLKYKPKGHDSLMSFLSINSNREFTSLEINAIKNMQNYRCSIFKIRNISKDNKTLFLEDTLHKDSIEVNMPEMVKNNITKKIILAIVAKRLDGSLYFFGPFFGYDEKEIPLLKNNFKDDFRKENK